MSDPTGPVPAPTDQVYGSVTGGSYVAECYDSPTFSMKQQSEASTHVKAIGYTTDVEAFAAISGWVNTYRPVFHGLYPDAIDMKPLAPGLWDANISYKVYQYDEDNLVDAQFNTAGGTERLYCSFGTTVCMDCQTGQDGEWQGGAIEVKDDGSVEGTDVKWPAFTWSQTQNYSLSAVNHSFKAMLASYTNCVNSSTFRGFDPGEVMFDGVSGQLQTKYDKTNNAPMQYWKLTFSFSVKRNRIEQIENATFTRGGWEHRWIKWKKIMGADGKSINVPSIVSCEIVYPEVELNNLPIVNIDPPATQSNSNASD